jgi:hypothetical protein
LILLPEIAERGPLPESELSLASESLLKYFESCAGPLAFFLFSFLFLRLLLSSLDEVEDE